MSKVLLAERCKLYATIAGAYLRRVDALLYDLAPGRTTVYCVDFEEVHNFIHEAIKTSRSDFAPSDFAAPINDELSKQYRLSLLRLFKATREARYVLPPHAEELVAHAKYITYSANDVRRVTRKVSDVRGALSATLQLKIDQDLVPVLRGYVARSMDEPATAHLTEQETRIVEFIKKECASLYLEIEHFMLAQLPLQRLSDLWKSGNLQLEWGALVPTVDIEELEGAALQERDGILQLFPAELRHKHRLGKVRDAAALVYLREINALSARLTPPVTVVLVTADESTRDVARYLRNSSTFHWNAVRDHLRSYQTVFLDLLTSTGLTHASRRNALATLRDFFAGLQVVLRGVAQTINDASDDDNVRLDSASLLLDGVWRQLMERQNLLLSEACAESEELRRFVGAPTDTGVSGADALPIHAILRGVAYFLLEPRYKIIAEKLVHETWRDLVASKASSLFLSRMTPKAVEAIRIAVRDPDAQRELVDRLVERSDRYGAVYSVCVRTPALATVQELMRRIRDGYANDSTGVEFQHAFDRALAYIVSEMRNDESYLFIAIILYTLDQTTDAMSVVQELIEDDAVNEALKVEAYLFLAIAYRDTCEDIPGEAVQRLQKSREYMSEIFAITQSTPDSTSDPRFMLQYALTILELADEQRLIKGTPDVAAVADALQVLKRGYTLIGEDRFLRYRFLNDLVYFGYLYSSDTGEYQAYASALRAQPFKFPTALHTLRLVALREAFESRGRANIELAAEDMERLLTQPNISLRLREIITLQVAAARSIAASKVEGAAFGSLFGGRRRATS